jgi:hypothetical protein
MQLTEQKLKQMIKQTLNESSSKVYGKYFKDQNLLSGTARKLDWDVLATMDFCLQLLEDVNAHDVMQKIIPIFDKEAENFDSEELGDN